MRIDFVKFTLCPLYCNSYLISSMQFQSTWS